MKLRNAAGVGVPRPKDAISEMEENILWEKGMLGFEDPDTLCNTVLFMVGIHFRLRGGQEHRAFRRYPKCQIEREVHDGKDCMVYHEEHLKNNQGGIHSQFYQKPKTVYAFCSGHEPHCFVHILDRYLELCPPTKFCSGFYLHTKPGWNKEQNFHNNYWYSRFPVGKNVLASTVKNMMEDAGIEGNFSNNSLRATTASRLYSKNVDEQLISEQTGHRSNAIRRYKCSLIQQKMEISKLLHAIPSTQAGNIPKVALPLVDLTGNFEKENVKSKEEDSKIVQNINLSDLV